MSKWHRVELSNDQFHDMLKELPGGILWADHRLVSEERVKSSVHYRIKNKDNSITIKRLETGDDVPNDQVFWVYKFKNEIEAMAFKLTWS